MKASQTLFVLLLPALSEAAAAAAPHRAMPLQMPLQMPQQKPQGEGVELVATYQIAGQRRTVSRNDLALELARRYRNGADGRATIEHLIDEYLVKTAAQSAGLMPTHDQVLTRVRGIQTQLKRQKMDLEQVLKQQRISREQFSEKIALSMALKRLTGKVLGIDPAKVTNQQTEMWAKEQRNKTKIETDQTKLPTGVLARMNGKAEVTHLDVGRVLISKITPAQLQESVHAIVFRECVAHEAREQGIEVTLQELQKSYLSRKKDFESNKRNQGISYEQWLKAFGSSKKNEMESKARITKVRHGKLVRKRYPASYLDDRFAKHRDAVTRRHGARRSMSILLVRASETPNRLLKRDFDAALKHIRDVRRKITDKNRSFNLMAKIASDDATTKKSGGKIGWQHAEYLPNSKAQRAPKQVLDAAFRLNVGNVSEPIRTKQGYYLVWVSGIEPEPDIETVRNRLLSEMARRYNRQLFEAAKIEILNK